MEPPQYFPPPATGDSEGILGISRDLNVPLLLDAYYHGIFPWPYEEQTILWCSPKQRGVLPLAEFHIPHRTGRDLKKWNFEFRVDCDFAAVIDGCAETERPGQEGTWITGKIRKAYKELHRLGYAHSFETYTPEGELAGGMYGVSIGEIFCGESMFFRKTGASKFALIHAVELLQANGVKVLDTQMVTPTTLLFGAREIPLQEYLALLELHRGRPLVLKK